jgi:superfamily II DNA helicase RecQ
VNDLLPYIDCFEEELALRPGDRGIIFCTTRDQAHSLAYDLKINLAVTKYRVDVYDASIERDDRLRLLQDFFSHDDATNVPFGVLVATPGGKHVWVFFPKI